jgi:Site-specific recombinase XerD
MNSLRESVTDYLAMRRSLGFKLRLPGSALFDFVSFLEERDASFITTRLALEWAQQPPLAKASTWAQKLSWVRGFAKYRSATDSRTEIPAYALLPQQPERARPYLYTDDEIQCLMQAAMKLESATEIKRNTYRCLIGLLAVSGMRIGEAIDLKESNVDLDASVITIEGAKFGKSRLVPLHASTQKELSDYKLLRNKFLRGYPATYFFVNNVGKRLDFGSVRRTFYTLSREIGIREPGSSSGPRLLDFRHRFAIETMLRWYRSGEDVERKLPILSTYLGHVHVSDTYWYLTAYPELMGSAVSRLEQHWEANS